VLEIVSRAKPLDDDSRHYRLLNSLVAQSKICPFGLSTTTDLKNKTTSDNNGI